jgi:hypothetical protein
MPTGIQWRRSVGDVADWSSGWIVPVALLEAADSRESARIERIGRERLLASLERPIDEWPSGFTKLPGGLPESAEARLSLAELAAVAAKRPGDVVLWRSVARRCAKMGMERGAALVLDLSSQARWPGPAPEQASSPWSAVDDEGLPASLVAVLRCGGSIACGRSRPGSDTAAAQSAFFAKVPDLASAEARAMAAATRPDPDALNLLAAIRLADPAAASGRLLQALAFAWQARALDPTHPYASTNVLRALRRLSMREEAEAFMRNTPSSAPGSWAQRERDKVAAWLGNGAARPAGEAR